MKFKRIVAAACAVAMLATSVLTTNVMTVQAQEGGTWVQAKQGNDNTWWYRHADGSYTKNDWEEIGGYWYYFDAAGYAVTGWQKIGENMQYFTLTSGGAQPICSWNAAASEEGRKQQSGSIMGVDVSKHQGNIDWQALKNAGVNFVFIRVGYDGEDSQAFHLDPKFESYIKAAEQVGIPAGVYYYSKATSDLLALDEAKWVVRQLRGKKVSYPVAIDLEDKSQRTYGRDAMTQVAKVFADEIRAAGYTPMVYCDESFAKKSINLNALSGVEKWVARYNYHYDTNVPRDVWQAGSTTRLPGITENTVDVDFSFKNYTTIIVPRTAASDSYAPAEGLWRQDGNGYWYQYTNSQYPSGQWKMINGKWYYFNGSGYLAKGWQSIDGKWYYFNTDGSGAYKTGWFQDGNTWYYMDASGAMQTGWVNAGGTWYYMNAGGALQTGWLKSGSNWYYMNGSGAMATGWVQDGNTWYYMDASGAMQTGWVNAGGTWYYMNAGGAMQTGWMKSGSTWYYLKSSGAMATGWVQDGNTWYYMDASGAMQTGWLNDGGTWYYLYGDGSMASNTTVDGYVLGANGAWVQ